MEKYVAIQFDVRRQYGALMKLELKPPIPAVTGKR